MKYAEIPRPMRDALGTYEMLRRLGFPSNDIHWHHNGDEPPGSPEPRGMMFVVLQTQGKSFTMRVGIVDTTYDAWRDKWFAVMQALLDNAISDKDYGRLLSESEAYRNTDALCVAIRAKDIRIPALES